MPCKCVCCTIGTVDSDPCLCLARESHAQCHESRVPLDSKNSFIIPRKDANPETVASRYCNRCIVTKVQRAPVWVNLTGGFSDVVHVI